MKSTQASKYLCVGETVVNDMVKCDAVFWGEAPTNDGQPTMVKRWSRDERVGFLFWSPGFRDLGRGLCEHRPGGQLVLQRHESLRGRAFAAGDGSGRARKGGISLSPPLTRRRLIVPALERPFFLRFWKKIGTCGSATNNRPGWLSPMLPQMATPPGAEGSASRTRAAHRPMVSQTVSLHHPGGVGGVAAP